MTTLRVPISYRVNVPTDYEVKVYAPMAKKKVIESFFNVTADDAVNIYNAAATRNIKTIEYLSVSAASVEFICDALITNRVLKQTMKKTELKQESLSILKPEIVGLGLGSTISVAIGIFALATRDFGLAAVMAGPLVASILGFTMLWIGIRRKKV